MKLRGLPPPINMLMVFATHILTHRQSFPAILMKSSENTEEQHGSRDKKERRWVHSYHLKCPICNRWWGGDIGFIWESEHVRDSRVRGKDKKVGTGMTPPEKNGKAERWERKKSHVRPPLVRTIVAQGIQRPSWENKKKWVIPYDWGKESVRNRGCMYSYTS